MATTAFLQKAYLAYFGRPVDFTGTTAFANSTELQVQNAFSASAESQALYGSTFGAAQINAIYLVLFGRAAEPAGLAYWSNQVQLGLLTPAGAAVGILNGALNADAIAVTNKLDASAKFTIGLDTTAKILGYSGNVAAASARDFLATVTATPVTPAQVDSGVSVAVVAGTANTNAGTTFTLTAGIDNLTGTAGSDTFTGDTATISAADTINGGAGIDTVRIIGATAAAGATLVATETASIVFAGLASGQSFTVAGRTVTATATVAAADVAIAMSGGAVAAGLTLSGALNGFTAAVTTTTTAVFTSTTASANVLNIITSATFVSPATAAAVLGVTTSEGSAGTAATVATATPVLNSIENVFFGAAANGVAFDARSVAGVTGVQFDAAAGAANSVSVTTGQSVTLSNTAVTNTTTIAGNTPTALTLNLNKVGAVTGTTDTVDFSGTALATLNLNSTGAASKIVLTNTGGAVATLNVTGDQGASINTLVATIKTVNASTATGAVSFDKSAATANAAFTFTGGSANDTLMLKAGDLALLTSGTQLIGGAGTADKLVTLDTTFAATDYAKINATSGFEVLGTGAAAAVVDAGQLTSIKSFSIDGDGIQAYTNLVTGSSFAVTAAHAATIGISTATGVSDVSIAIGTATTAGLAIGGTVTLAGATTVALSSNGTNAAANVISALSNVVNSNITITGSNDLTITSGLTGTLGATGSVVNAAAFTGKLTVTGSGAGDIITGGSGVDIITGGSGADIVTGGAGADIFVFSGTAAANTSGVVFGQADVITDFVVGVDKLQFSNVTDIVSGQQIAVQAAVTALAAGSSATQIATAMATASTTALGVSVATFGGNTYVLYETSASAGAVGVAADDVFIQLTGVASGFTFANSVIA